MRVKERLRLIREAAKAASTTAPVRQDTDVQASPTRFADFGDHTKYSHPFDNFTNHTDTTPRK